MDLRRLPNADGVVAALAHAHATSDAFLRIDDMRTARLADNGIGWTVFGAEVAADIITDL